MNPSTSSREKPPASRNRRREFLTGLAGVAALAVVPFAGRFSIRRNGAASTAADAVIPNLAAFMPHVGSEFVAETAGSQPAIPLTLTVAEGLKPCRAGAAAPYSLRFAVPKGRSFDSRIYDLQHPVLGSLTLFISPVGPPDPLGGPQVGEAIINPFVLES